MKATITFNLSKPETDDEFNFQLATRAKDLAFIIYDLNAWLRDEINSERLKRTELKAYEAIQYKLFELIEERGVKNITLEMP